MARCLEELANKHHDRKQAAVILAGMIYTMQQIIQDGKNFDKSKI